MRSKTSKENDRSTSRGMRDRLRSTFRSSSRRRSTSATPVQRDSLVPPTAGGARFRSSSVDSRSPAPQLDPPQPKAIQTASYAQYNAPSNDSRVDDSVTWKIVQWRNGLQKAALSEKLSPKEKKVLEALLGSHTDQRSQYPSIPVPIDSQPPESLETVRAIVREEMDKRSQASANGQESPEQSSIREYVARILTVLDKFAIVGDTMVQHDPSIVALAWGGFRFLLQCSINATTNHSAVFTALENIEAKIIKCEYHAQVFLEIVGDLDSPLARDYEDALVTFYMAVIIFTIKARLYIQSWSPSVVLLPFEEYFRAFTKDIEDCERKLLEYVEEAQRRWNLSTAKRTEELLAGIKDVERSLGDLLRDVGQVNQGIKALTDRMEGDMQKLEGGMQDLNIGIDRIISATSEKTKEIDREELMKCRKWLPSIDQNEYRESYSKQRAPETSQWIFKIQEYTEWKQAEKGILWIHGGAGSGKSVLSGSVCDTIISNTEETEEHVFLYAFFQDPSTAAREHRRKRQEASETIPNENKHDNTNSATRVVASLIQQLLSYPAHQNTMFEILREAYKNHSHSQCTSLILWDMLSKMLESVQAKTTILLDALDECTDPPAMIEKLASLKACSIVTSRPEPPIKKAFDRLENVFSVGMSVGGDILKFVTDELREDPRLRNHIEEIVAKVCTGAPEQSGDGLFLYARLVINELREGVSHCTIPETIAALPPLIDEMYTLLIKRLPTRLAQIRKTVLTMISVAFRPLTIEEVAYIYAASRGGEFDPGPNGSIIVSEEKIREACGSLVMAVTDINDHEWIPKSPIAKEDYTLRFTHLAVKDFVLRHPDQTLASELASEPLLVSHEIALHSSASLLCVLTLSDTALSTGVPEGVEFKENLDFPEPLVRARWEPLPGLRPLSYPAQFWGDHAEVLSRAEVTLPDRLRMSIRSLVFEDTSRFKKWRKRWQKLTYHNRPLLNLGPVGCIAYFGLRDLIESALEFGHSVIDHDTIAFIRPDPIHAYKAQPLIIAATFNRVSFVKELLSRSDVDVNCPSNRCFIDPGRVYSYPLLSAAARGHTEMVRLLLSQPGVRFDVTDTRKRTPFFAACEGGYIQIVSLLIARPDVQRNVTDCDNRTPLLRAYEGGHTEVVDQLLALPDTDINAVLRDKHWSKSRPKSILELAASRGDLELVNKLLSDPRLSINKPNSAKDEGTLSWAIMGGDVRVVKKILTHPGIGTSGPADGCVPPMVWAGGLKFENREVLDVLIAHGFDLEAEVAVSTQDQSSWTLDPTGDTYMTAGMTALLYAAELGNVWNIETLLKAGAQVDHYDHGGVTPLIMAAHERYNSQSPEIVEMLLHAGANINAADHRGKTPLMAATRGAQPEMMATLLQAGADINAADNKGRTPLMFAAVYGSEKTIAMLLQAGADINAADFEGRTPLLWAARRFEGGVGNTLAMMFQAGADINAVDRSGRTILSHYAEVAGGVEDHDLRGINHEEIIRLLIIQGADANIRDLEGRKPVDWAVAKGKMIVARVLTNLVSNEPDHE